MRKMRNYLWWWLLLVACCLNLGSIKAKPLVSFGIGVQTASRPYPEPYYNNYYGYNGYYGGGTYSNRYQPPGYPYYPAPYAPGSQYGALDFGIGALSLTPFLL
ncbi:uncharacterized protein LOC117571871 [Drosophila albomicans]|uniref:Uncharacterized protein LOC117571871 n=1 Tax=Drosophila albomicans TaxID=7291 RepID=A0A6P8YYY9_DROAB|nr:uncharacterized protein LOC117571871 [Drosophila albomicans]